MKDLTRRGFLVGCSSAIAAYAGSRFNTVAFGDPGAKDSDIVVHVFLRGGMDGLNFMPPIGGNDRAFYEMARPDLQVPATGADAALPVNSMFGLHPSAMPIHELFQDGYVALIQAVGLDEANRSHFDAMQFIELGTPGDKSSTTGWLTRHLHSLTLPGNLILPSMSLGSLQQTSLLGHLETLNVDDPGQFALNTGPYQWRTAQRTALRELYNRDSWLHNAGWQTLNALDIVELNTSGSYTPSNGATYPNGRFGDHLESLARMIKLDLGLRVATLDLGGWDTHNGQGNGSGGYFANLVGQLAQGLHAFFTDLNGNGEENYTQRLTMIVQSEFGRRLRQNDDDGSDHGHGNVMMVLSGNVNGGVYGSWPGLATEQLFDNADVAVTTDYRRVLSEIVVRRLNNGDLPAIFPDYNTYNPLGFMQGDDSALNQPLFCDSFETGDTSMWSVSRD